MTEYKFSFWKTVRVPVLRYRKKWFALKEAYIGYEDKPELVSDQPPEAIAHHHSRTDRRQG